LRHPPATVAEAAAKISALTGITRKPTQVRHFLKQLGMAPRKVAAIPAKADVDAQAQFKTETLEPKLEEAQRGQRAVYFVDAAHFVLAPFLGIVWCFARLFLKAPAGRQRFNVLGALHAITKHVVTVTNDSYITAVEVCQLLDQLAALHPGLPISVVLDNARYQRCALVQEHARRLQIELLFLPSYSPNLNLIERFWKYVKKECLYSKYYPAFAEFKQAIANCIAQARLKHQAKLESLLSLRFQVFHPDAVRAA
jgi:transposase